MVITPPALLINGIIDRLIKVNKDFGITLLVIEHNMRVIMQLAQQIFCLAHGQLIANGTPDEIKNDQRVIAAYLGVQKWQQINILYWEKLQLLQN